MNAHALVAALVVGTVCGSVAIAGAEVRSGVSAPAPGYAIASWSTADGRSIGPVRALAQDRAGYLWVGTDGGLLRFDGFDFTNVNAIVDTPLPGVGVRALYYSPSDELWVGLADGGGIYCIRNGHVTGGPLKDVPGNVNTFADDPATHTLWAGHDGGLLKSQRGAWAAVPPSAGLPRSAVFHLRVDTSQLLVGSARGFFHGDRTGERFDAVPTPAETTVRDTLPSVDGSTWLTDPRSGLRRLDRPTPSTHPGRGTRFLKDSHGQLWLGTLGQGIWRIDVRTGDVVERVSMRDGLLNDGIGALLEDREQNLWVGTYEGLNRLTAHSVTPLLGLTLTSSVARGANGVMWVASTDGVSSFEATGDTRRQQLRPLQGVRTLYPDPTGRVWVATDDGLLRLDRNQTQSVVTPASEAYSRVTAITGDTRGTVWFADARKGLWSWSGGALAHVVMPPSYDGARVTALLARADGLWVAFEHGRLARLGVDNVFRVFEASDGFDHDTIYALHDGPQTGLWVAGTHGVSHFDGTRFVTLERPQGLPARRATGVVEDRDGGLWVALASIGIAHLGRPEVARALKDPHARLHPQVIDTSDGLAGMPTSLDSLTAATDDTGRLWFVTGRGLTVVDRTSAFTRPRTSGPARIEAAFADDHRLQPDHGLDVPAGTSRLRIVYTAVSLSTAEHTRFRYRLEGFDDDWHDAGANRQAVYTNLPPRQYRFVLQAEANDGAVTTTTADWSFRMAPRFYQTWSFYFLSAAIVAVTATGAWRMRLRHVRREYDIVLAERNRVSRELHDTLLQTMAGVALHVDAVATRLPKDTDAAHQLVSVRQAIEDGIVEARQVIWQMRTGGDNGDLVAALEAMAAHVTAGTPVRFRLRVIGAPRLVHDPVHRELLRIAQEAVTNAVRHGHPVSVSIELRYDENTLMLRVSDDGVGFDAPTASATHHFGLLTMQERTQQLGGHFQLTSTVGAGTQIEATVPL